MTRLDALTSLRDNVQAGEWWPGLAQIAIGGVQTYHNAKEAFEGSLDAAKALHEAVLPGWENGMDSASMCWVKQPGLRTSHRSKYADNPARAWLLAILEALIAQEKEKT